MQEATLTRLSSRKGTISVVLEASNLASSFCELRAFSKQSSETIFVKQRDLLDGDGAQSK